MNWTIFAGSVVYALLGIVIFMIAYKIFDLLAPSWKVTKILVEDKNIGLGIVIAGIFIGLAIIISSAIK